MFRSSIIIRELALNLAKVIFMLKHSVKLRRYLLCGCVAACHTATQPHNKQRRNFTECFNINITLARFSASSLMMIEDRNM
jgi:hypothetical protein